MKKQDPFKDSDTVRGIVQLYLDTGSVKKTADEAGISEVKARRILLTENLWSSDTSIRVGHYYQSGLTTKEIAGKLYMTEKAVQQYLPYSRGLYLADDRSLDAVYSAEYRKRIKTAQQIVNRRRMDLAIQEGWEENHMLEVTGTGKIKAVGEDVFRLHLELIQNNHDLEPVDDGHLGENDPGFNFDEEEKRVLRNYGGVRYGTSISRDLLVPGGIPLYALHYAIQAAFGWENSHLHHFELPPRQFFTITDGKAGKWSQLVGVLFRSPYMEEYEQFWADDYENGSFKNWLRTKYTGPYVSLCHGEGIIQCTKDMKKYFHKNQLIMVDYSRYEGTLYVSDARQPKGAAAGECPIPEGTKNMWDVSVEKRGILPLSECPISALERLYIDANPRHLLERLPVEEIIALHGKSPEDVLSEIEKLYDTFDSFMDEDLLEDIAEIRKSGENDPYVQPIIGTPTDVLYYLYDYGDDWKVRITACEGADDLLEQGRITREELDDAVRKVYETYRPVCIAADGLPVVDDAGGIHGYLRFLRAIHPTEEKTYWGKDNRPDNSPYEDKQNSLS